MILFTSKELLEKCNEFLKDKKYSNNVVDILSYCEVTSVTPACILAVERIFVNLLSKREMIKHHLQDEGSAEWKYREWLQECYGEAWIKLLAVLQNKRQECKLQALVTLFKLLAAEGTNPINKIYTRSNQKKNFFPVSKLTSILRALMKCNGDITDLVNRMTEYTACRDVSSNIWKAMDTLLKAQEKPEDKEIQNLLHIIEKLPNGKSQSDLLLCNNKHVIPEERQIKNTVRSVWDALSRWHHPPATHRLLLLTLLEHIMPSLENPAFLTDYLMESMGVGGGISVLALQGIFTLIQKHNIEYPDIYGKLYAMLTPEIFSTKYKARLVYLADIFLTSTHLPENLVAAFAKRLARISLVTTPENILIIIPFIGNLLLRHPGLKKLINHTTGGEVNDDPYIEDEKDPAASRALDSSLWELQILQNHVLPRVANAAHFINNPLPSVEWNLSSLLDYTSDNMFAAELKKKQKTVPVTFEKSKCMVLPRGNNILQCWSFT